MRFHRIVTAASRGAGYAAAVMVALGAVPVSGSAANAAADAAISAYLDAWNGATGRLAGALGPDFVDRTSLLPLDAPMFEAQIARWRAAVPDLKVTMLERADGTDAAILRLRFEGRVKDPASLLPVTPGAIRIEQTERLALHGGRIASRAASIDDWTLPLEWMFVPPAAQPFQPHVVESVATFAPGSFLESVAIAPDGTLYVSTGIDGGIASIDKAHRVRKFARLDVGPGGFMMCVRFDARGVLYATVNSRNPAVLGVWRFDQSGRGTRIGELPAGAVPNGFAFDGNGNILIADSFGGVVWRVPAGGGVARVWLRHPWLMPRPLVGRFPGANGLQRDGNSIIVAVSDRSQLIRVPILADGAAGKPLIVSATLPADDFAVAPDGTIYLTTHPFNTVVRLERDGRQSVIAGPAQGVAGPTSAVLGGDGWLYVATDGGLYRPLPGVAPTASVVRIRIGADARP